MKATKRIVEEAALLCQVWASTPDAWSKWLSIDVEESLELGEEAHSLAADAAHYTIRELVPKFGGYAFVPSYAKRDGHAEAEARLRTGWLPEGWTK